MKITIICIFLSLFVTGLFTCSTTNESVYKASIYAPTILKEKSKPVFYFMEGIDDTYDTSKYKCINMISREYDSIIKEKEKRQRLRELLPFKKSEPLPIR